MTTMNRLTFDQIATASLDRLTDELAAAHWDSTHTEIYDARGAVALMLLENYGPFYLMSEADEIVREATEDEAVESCQTPEGWIEVDGGRFYVSEA